MSRTTRRPRPRFHKQSTTRVRDGSPQHYSWGCRHHGDCTWCANGRQHASRRQEPIT